MTGTVVLDVAGLSARYRQVTVLRRVDLRIDAGSAVGLGGLNGAGKSTLLGALSGVVAHDADRLELSGRALPRGPHRRAAAGLAHVPEGRRVFTELTVADNLAYGAVASGHRRRAADAARAQVLDVFPQLAPLLERRAGQLSGGEQQMLAIGRGMMAQPRLLMVDELSLGLSPRASEQISAGLSSLRELYGTTLLLVDQNLGLLSRTCEALYVLSDGLLTPIAHDSATTAAAAGYF